MRGVGWPYAAPPSSSAAARSKKSTARSRSRCGGAGGIVEGYFAGVDAADASLKPAQPIPPYPIDLGNIVNGKVTLTNVTLTECLRFAFKINNDNQIVGPDWMQSRDALFDIVAKAPPETTRDTARLMMLNFLMERFQLKLHHEQRELPYLALVVDKRGSKLRGASDTADAAAITAPAGPTMFDAVEEQLGLKLETRKGPMDVIVIDHAGKTPIAN